MIDDKLAEQIKQISLSNSNEEVCGFIVDNKDIFECANKAIDPVSSFRIDADDYLNASSCGKITAVYHSHRNSDKFSDYDLTQCKAYKLPFLMFCNKTQTFDYIEPDNIAENPYIGRAFQLGKSDCYTLVEDFYNKEFNITLPKFERNDQWRDTYKNLINYYKSADFVDVVDNYLRGDIIILDMLNEGIGSHLAIYLSQDSILHHRRDWASNIIFYSSTLKKKTLAVIRHKSLCN